MVVIDPAFRGGIARQTKGVTMADEPKIEASEVAQKTRRAFVKSAAQVAVTAPAVGLLLSATSLPAAAQTINPYEASQLHILDDFTFGNNEEDIDALAQHTNFNPNNGTANLDDIWVP